MYDIGRLETLGEWCKRKRKAKICRKLAEYRHKLETLGEWCDKKGHERFVCK